jgi:hypothetical protein
MLPIRGPTRRKWHESDGPTGCGLPVPRMSFLGPGDKGASLNGCPSDDCGPKQGPVYSCEVKERVL